MLEREIEKIVEDFLKADDDEKAAELFRSAVIVLAAEKMIADANAGERSDVAKKIVDMLGRYTIPLSFMQLARLLPPEEA